MYLVSLSLFQNVFIRWIYPRGAIISGFHPRWMFFPRWRCLGAGWGMGMESFGRRAIVGLEQMCGLRWSLRFTSRCPYPNLQFLTLSFMPAMCGGRRCMSIISSLLTLIYFTVNGFAIIILSRGNCGLSTCTAQYLAAMATTDLLVIITDVILRRINDYYFEISFLWITPCTVFAMHFSVQF